MWRIRWQKSHFSQYEMYSTAELEAESAKKELFSSIAAYISELDKEKYQQKGSSFERNGSTLSFILCFLPSFSGLAEEGTFTQQSMPPNIALPSEHTVKFHFFSFQLGDSPVSLTSLSRSKPVTLLPAYYRINEAEKSRILAKLGTYPLIKEEKGDNDRSSSLYRVGTSALSVGTGHFIVELPLPNRTA